MSFKIKPNKIGELKNMQQSRLTSVEVSVHIGRRADALLNLLIIK